MRRLVIALTGLVMAAGVLFAPTAAQALESAGTATFDATVDSTITFAFTGGNTVHLGSLLAGETKTTGVGNSISPLTYSVTTNNATGFHLSVGPDGSGSGSYTDGSGPTGTGVTFHICPLADGATCSGGSAVLGAFGSIRTATYRSQSGPGAFNYSDNIQVEAGGMAVGQLYTVQERYYAITN